MSETAITNDAAAGPSSIKGYDQQDQPSSADNDAANAGEGVGVNADNQESSQDDNNFLLSHVVPPSHILADGRFIQLPPPSALERSQFFERAVAVHHLISGDGEDEKKSNGAKSNNKRQKDDDDDDDASATSARDRKRKKKSSDAPFVHPLAIASARIRAKGTDELSKSINLGGLVIGGEYFGLTNIVNQRGTTGGVAAKKGASDAAPGAEGKGKDGGDGVAPSAANGDSSAGAPDAADESALLDGRLRSRYVLVRRRAQYASASTVLARHERRLVSSVSVQRVLDARLRALRRRWRLVAPEHGTRTVGPVRPREVVSVDVEVYDRDRLGGGSHAASNGQSSMGRIARRVPRFATMELDDDYDVSVDILELRRKTKEVLEGLKKMSETDGSLNGSSSVSMEVDNRPMESSSPSDVATKPSNTCKTKAEPFAIADPTLGKIDLDFDPDKVPLLTLLLEIEKPSTGFVERATLSSSFSANSDGKWRLQPDERVIEALQHSLFCASLFESMRTEIIPNTPAHANNVAASHHHHQQRQKSVAWLSSEMEESFLPPPSVMAGEDTSQMLCVIHCHEGEVKVQLDDEYSLTVKLIEAGTAAAAAAADGSSNDDGATSLQQQQHQAPLGGCGNGAVRASSSSGSQSPAQLRTLCRALLLHSQSLYHDHCMKEKMKNNDKLEKKKEKKVAVGFARTKKEVEAPSPHILQSCVSYGCKSIFEKKVRLVLKRLSRWLAKNMNCPDKIYVEWLPLALFDSHSRFALLFRDQICLDVGIKGDVLRVTQTSGPAGEFRAVAFGSELEFECFLKFELRRALADE